MVVLYFVPYRVGFDSSSFSEFGRWHRHDWHTQQHNQYKQTMIAMHNSIISLLHCQQKMQNGTTCVLWVILQSQRDHANYCLINDIPKFDGKSILCFNWILKLENIVLVWYNAVYTDNWTTGQYSFHIIIFHFIIETLRSINHTDYRFIGLYK